MCALYRPYFSSALTLLTQPSFSSFYQIQSQIKFKTELCKNYIRGFCQYSNNCIFAHGQQELREKVFPEGQEKICRYYYESGTCPYGVKCQFKHVLQTIAGVTIIFEEMDSESLTLNLKHSQEEHHNCLHNHRHLSPLQLEDEISSDIKQIEIRDQVCQVTEKEIKAHVNFEEILAIKEPIQQQKEQDIKNILPTKKQFVPVKFTSKSIWSSSHKFQESFDFASSQNQKQQNQQPATTKIQKDQKNNSLNLDQKEAQKSVLQFLVENSHISKNLNFDLSLKEEQSSHILKSQRKRFKRVRFQGRQKGQFSESIYSSFLLDPISYRKERLNVFKRLEHGSLSV